MSLALTNCFCGSSFDPDQFMIQCDICQQWSHGRCVSVKEYEATEIEKYHCPRCEEKNGFSIKKVRTNWHRHNYTESEADSKPVQTGTPIFIKELKSRHFAKAEDIVKYLKGQQLTVQYLQTNGFEVPIIVDNKDGLDMIVPSQNFNVHDIKNYLDGEKDMDVIDVSRQNNIRMKLKDFIEYYNNPFRSRILNVISLEFTNTRLSPLVEAPYIARKLDWVNYVWPRDWSEESELKKPEVQKYCLIGVKDSFTDFHIDFGGTSVWYHVLRGEKIFYLIKPSPANLQLYQQWMCSSTQSETFFGDQVDICYKCNLKQGQTMLIPTGWIHAVLTSMDSLVFGGNFLHSLNITMQIQIYEIERKIKTPPKFQYPGFETINWFAAKRLLKELKDLNSEGRKCPLYILKGIKALLSILKIWNTDKDYNMFSRCQIPNTINSQKLLKDLSKEIRYADKFLITLNPPKPERESQRKRKKPSSKVFIDVLTNNSSVESLKEKTKKDQIINHKSLSNKKISIRPPLKMTLSKFVTSNHVPPTKIIKTNNSSDKNVNSEKLHSKKKLSDQKQHIDQKIVLKSKKKKTNVICLKLNNKEVVRNAKDRKKYVHGNFKLDSTIETRKELTWKQTSSVYDFHDGSNESNHSGYAIDETPNMKKREKSADIFKKSKRQTDSKLHESINLRKNGIEELLKASVYTLGSSTSKLDNMDSPSTRDAVAGMLSFSTQCYSTSTETNSKIVKSSKTTTKISKSDDEDYLSIENVDKVHQDDDFIYPALDASDEEDFFFKSKNKREDDEAWNPKVRVGPLLPKTNRPSRDGAKKTSVEKGLEAAAKKLAKQSSSSKRSLKRKKGSQSLILEEITTTAISATELGLSSLDEVSRPDIMVDPSSQVINFKSILTSPNRLNIVKAKLAAPIPAERKPKKGMKTAKQRLGKILKIHKMLH